jgi:uncharacterized membrane protein
MLPGWLKTVRWQVVAVALVCGGIVHIAATLLVPHLATGNAVQRLFADLPANRMRVLPATRPDSQSLPFMSPDARYAVCRFDIGGGPIVVSALLPDKGWSFALYTPDGDNFYAVPAPDARRAEISFVLVPPVERPTLGFLHLGRVAADTRASEIAVPQREGLLVVRASLRGQSYTNEVETQLARASCGLRRG